MDDAFARNYNDNKTINDKLPAKDLNNNNDIQSIFTRYQVVLANS